MFKLVTFVAVVALAWSLFLLGADSPVQPPEQTAPLSLVPVPTAPAAAVEPTAPPAAEPPPALQAVAAVPPLEKTLKNDYHVFQTFNNCGPASLSMTLSYFNINVSQEELGRQLRPYQNPKGDNDDKSVTLDELADKAQEFGLATYHRPNGTVALVKSFIAADMPIVVRTLTKMGEDIGHYRIIKGYSDIAEETVQDDSLQGKNLRFSYEKFNALWESFGYEYLVLVPQEKVALAEAIIGEDIDTSLAWHKAAERERALLEREPENIAHRFNLSVALYHAGEYEQSVAEFEKVEHELPFRTLWYQIEPIQAYFALERYDRVFKLTDRVLNRYNRAFSELYLLRGEIYKRRGDFAAARAEFEKAVFYNTSMKQAQEALDALHF